MGPEPEVEPASALGEEPSDPAPSEPSDAGIGLGVFGSELPALSSELAGGVAGAVVGEESLGVALGAAEASLGGGLSPSGAALAGGEPSAASTAGATAPGASPGPGPSAASAL